MTKNIFIAATRQNDGKTVISIGLFLALKNIQKKLVLSNRLDRNILLLMVKK